MVAGLDGSEDKQYSRTHRSLPFFTIANDRKPGWFMAICELSNAKSMVDAGGIDATVAPRCISKGVLCEHERQTLKLDVGNKFVGTSVIGLCTFSA